MARKKSPEKQAYWQEVLERQAGSGLSIRQFCARAGVLEPSFYAWRKKLRESTKDGRRLASGRRDSDKAPLFVPVKLLDSAPALEIIHPLGYRIQMIGEVNPVALRHVIETLDERGSP